MKILKQDRKAGVIRVRVESDDDLWHLYNLIRPGDVVHALTERREETASDKIRNERGEKKKMYLGIEVEKVEFHEFSDRLRILGIIVEGPQDLGSHHTLNIESGDELTIRKERWASHDLKRLKEAVDSAGKPSVIFVSLEDDEAVVAVLYQYGIKELATVRTSGGKMYSSGNKKEYYSEIIDVIKRLDPRYPVILCGPGFAKERLFSMLKEKNSELAKRCRIVSTGQAGMAGIHEVMKEGLGQEILQDSRINREIRLVEKLMENIGKNGLAAYGEEEVKQAIKLGAVETLLVTDRMVRKEGVEEIMQTAEAIGADVSIISSLHEGGKRVEALGGIAAILRYRIET